MDTPATSDLCDEHGDAVHVVDLDLVSYGKLTAFSGPAVTVAAFEDNSLVKAALEEPGAGRVLVVDGGSSRRCALVGGNLAKAAVDHGWHGIIVNGAVRDTAELAGLPIGVLALGTSPRRSEKHGHGRRDITARLGSAVINTGDLVVADADGVVVVPLPPAP